MKIQTSRFRVKEGRKVKLGKWATEARPFYESKAEYEKLLGKHIETLRELQPMLYADDRYALLIIFQAMDAAGKDGAIKHVMSGVNPQGTQVTSFKHPGPDVLAHDFLWNAARFLPERGRIGIFNRSYYEEVLILRVHPDLLRAERVPHDEASTWESRYRSIRGFERHLDESGTRVIKFFLHLSREEQRKRFLARLDDPEKLWKFSEGDLVERKCWDDYMDAYEACLSATSTRRAPWFVVPADDKENARLIVSQIIIETLKDMPIAYPKVTEDRRKELRALRAALQRKGA